MASYPRQYRHGNVGSTGTWLLIQSPGMLGFPGAMKLMGVHGKQKPRTVLQPYMVRSFCRNCSDKATHLSNPCTVGNSAVTRLPSFTCRPAEVAHSVAILAMLAHWRIYRCCHDILCLQTTAKGLLTKEVAVAMLSFWRLLQLPDCHAFLG